jgi:enoyl-CoA hydratase/carnithine racemase
MNLLRLQASGPVTRLLINHPQRRNAFTRQMWRAMPALVQQASADARCRVLVLQSASPGMFAAGADISEFEATYATAEEAARAGREIEDAGAALAACPLPVLALIDGPCVGGGLALALACDMRIASARSRFGITAARLGLSYPVSDIARLVQACGLPAASELLYGTQLWSAQRALQTGLLNQVHELDALDAAADDLLQAIGASSLDATRALKQALRAVASGEASALDQACQTFVQMFAGPDFIEGRDAFLQKRPTHFPSHQP